MSVVPDHVAMTTSGHQLPHVMLAQACLVRDFDDLVLVHCSFWFRGVRRYGTTSRIIAITSNMSLDSNSESWCNLVQADSDVLGLSKILEVR